MFVIYKEYYTVMWPGTSSLPTGGLIRRQCNELLEPVFIIVLLVAPKDSETPGSNIQNRTNNTYKIHNKTIKIYYKKNINLFSKNVKYII